MVFDSVWCRESKYCGQTVERIRNGRREEGGEYKAQHAAIGIRKEKKREREPLLTSE